MWYSQLEGIISALFIKRIDLLIWIVLQDSKKQLPKVSYKKKICRKTPVPESLFE